MLKMVLDNSSLMAEYEDNIYNITPVLHGNMTDSHMYDMYDTPYGKRFIPYSILSASCILLNIVSLLAMSQIRHHHTVHHVLLVNLAVCDITGSALLWMYCNSPLIFPRFRISTLEHCMFITVVLVAPFILALCNSLCSLLMLALNQYLAICDPIWTTTKMTTGKVRGGIALAWIFSALMASIPAFVMLFLNNYQHCSPYAASMGQKSLEICAYTMVGVIILIVSLYARIYRTVVKYRRAAPVRRNRGTNGRHAETETNYKAFLTTMLLTGTLMLFWLPYMVFHFISAHVDIEVIPDFVLYAKVYFIDFLPMFNFLTDPFIYGIRVREIRRGYKRLGAKLLPCWVKSPHRSLRSNTTIRFSTLESDSVVITSSSVRNHHNSLRVSRNNSIVDMKLNKCINNSSPTEGLIDSKEHICNTRRSNQWV